MNSQRTARNRTGYTATGHANIGTCFRHTVINGHLRVASDEFCADEKVTSVGLLQRAVAWLGDLRVTVARVLSDNGPPATAPMPSDRGPTAESDNSSAP